MIGMEKEQAEHGICAVVQPKLKPCVIFLVVLTIVQMITVVCLLGVWYHVRQPVPPREDTMCIPVEHDDDMPVPDLLINITEGGRVKYCGKGSDVIKWSTEREMDKLYDGNEHPEPKFSPELMPRNCHKTDKVRLMSHLTEIDMEKTKATSNKQSMIYWKGESVSETYVVIKQYGLYRVSAHVVLKTDLETIEVVHSLHLKRNGTDHVIMEDREGFCESYAKIDPEREVTTSMAAMFELKMGDELYLTISHPEYIVYRTEKHHFIIYQT